MLQVKESTLHTRFTSSRIDGASRRWTGGQGAPFKASSGPAGHGGLHRPSVFSVALRT